MDQTFQGVRQRARWTSSAESLPSVWLEFYPTGNCTSRQSLQSREHCQESEKDSNWETNKEAHICEKIIHRITKHSRLSKLMRKRLLLIGSTSGIFLDQSVRISFSSFIQLVICYPILYDSNISFLLGTHRVQCPRHDTFPNLRRILVILLNHF